MQNILVPVDFSNASKSSLNYAVQLATHLKCSITILHIYHVPLTPEVNAILTKESDAKKEISEKINSFFKTQLAKAGKTIAGIEIRFSFDFTNEVDKLAKKLKSGLIIIGKSKSSYIEKVVFGNHLTNLMNNTKFPVLAVPEGYSFRPLNKNILATNLTGFKHKKHADILLKLSHAFNAEISVLNVAPYIRDHDDRASLKKQLDNFAAKLSYDHTTTHLIENASVSNGVEEYSKHKAATLVAMVFHHHNLIERIFSPNNSKNIAVNLDRPLLVIPD